MGAKPSLLVAEDESLWVDADIMHEGVLDKQRHYLGGWLERYFILLENGVLLSCIKSSKQNKGVPSEESEGGVQFASAKVYLVLSPSCKLTPTIWEGDNRSTFQIEDTETKQIFHFGAATESIRDRWKMAMKDVIDICGASVGASNASADLRLSKNHEHILMRLPNADVDEKAALPKASRAPKLKLDMFVNPNAEQAGERAALRESIKSIITSSVTAASLSYGAGVLVVDEPSMTAISSMCTMQELTDAGVGEVVRLEQANRSTMAGYDVVYLVVPDHTSSKPRPVAKVPGKAGEAGGGRGRSATTTQITSVDRLIADWELPFQKRPMYDGGKATILFLTRPANEGECLAHFDGASRLTASLTAPPKYLNAGFELMSDGVFNVLGQTDGGAPSPLVSLFAPAADSMNQALNEEAARLAEVCIALGEFPVIHYNMDCLQSVKLSNTLQMELENALALNRTWWRHGTDSRATGDPVQLLVMSRSEDLASPFLHSYTTDAVVRDVLQDQFKGADRIEYATKSRKNEAMTSTVVVNSTNKLWAALSRRRIYDASSDVHGLIKRLGLTTSGMLDNGKKDGMSMTQVSDGVAKMHRFQNMKKDISGVQHLITESLQRLRAIGDAASDPDILPLRVALFEQALVSHGVYVDTEFSCAAKSKKDLKKVLDSLLKDLGDEAAKERLVALWAVSPFGAGESVEGFEKMLGGRSSGIRNTVAALQHLKQHSGVDQGASDSSKADAARKKAELEAVRALTKREDAQLLELTDRFTPTVATRLAHVINGESDMAIVRSSLRPGGYSSPAGGGGGGGGGGGASSFASPATPKITKSAASASASVRGKGRRAAAEKSYFGPTGDDATDKRAEEERLDALFKSIFDGQQSDSQAGSGIISRGTLRSKSRFMVYMIGGLTHYEKQKLLALENERCEIIIGTDSIITAKTMLTELKSPKMREPGL